MTPYSFGQKLAQELRFPDQPHIVAPPQVDAPPLPRAPESANLPPADPLGVGPMGARTGGYGRAHLLGNPRPLSELLQGNRNIPRQLQSKPKPKTLDIRPNKPIRVIDPNKQTT